MNNSSIRWLIALLLVVAFVACQKEIVAPTRCEAVTVHGLHADSTAITCR